jgi:dephospho-CoA kinase
MKIIGLTGSISTGKSFVTSLLQDEGIAVLDMDKVGKDIMKKGSSTLASVIKEFGSEYLLENGELDRIKLGKLIFHDASARKRLNAITMPAILWEAGKHISWELIRGTSLLIIDSPLLIEEKLHKSWFVSKVIVVSCDKKTQVTRLMERDQIDEEFANSKINSQMPIEEKVKVADYVIDNSGSREETVSQVKKLIREVLNPIRGSNFTMRNFSLLALAGLASLILYYFKSKM